MVSVETVKELAQSVGSSEEALLRQIRAAGLPGPAITHVEQVISEEQKQAFLEYLQSSPIKLTRTRVRSVALDDTVHQGKGKKLVNIKVRKRRVYVKRSGAPKSEESSEPDKEAAVVEASSDDPHLFPAEQTPQVAESAHAESEVSQEPAIEEVQSLEPVPVEPPSPFPPEKTPSKDEKSGRKSGSGEGKRSAKKRLKQMPPREGRTRRRAPRKIKRGASGSTSAQHTFSKPVDPVVRDVMIPETITVSELSKRMSVKASEVIKLMMIDLDIMATINQVLDQTTAEIVVDAMGHKPVVVHENAIETALANAIKSGSEIVVRAPVVTIMGHVDHGKTSLLDYIRRTKVVAGEAGGITQHIGAYHVGLEKGQITFLDTPGHAAFTAMRARGAQVTDIVVLIVAADDGVKPQTIEAITHAKAANVPIVVAINKMDVPGVDPEKIKTALSNYEVTPEEWGGHSMFVPISAKTGEGVDDLLDAILLQAEILELKAVRDGAMKGVVIESRLDKGRGPVATILVQSGTLHQGDIVLAGLEYGHARALLDEKSCSLREAGPSLPVEILGLSGVPRAGDDVVVVANEKKAREVALFRQGKYRDVQLSRRKKISLEGLFDRVGGRENPILNLVLKADVQGSVEALNEALVKLSNEQVSVNIVSSGVGGITASDVNLAIASTAVMIGFNVRADIAVRRLAERAGIELRYYSVIYEVIEQVKQALKGMLKPEFKETIVGVAEVRDVFRSPKLGAVAGCMVIEGLIKRNNPIRVLRDNTVIYEGALESLKRFKEDASEVRQGLECGVGVKNYNDIKMGDRIEVYEIVEVTQA